MPCPDRKYVPAHGIVKAPLYMQVTIPLSRKHGPLFRQIYVHLRESILSGTFKSGEKLPATRDLAEQLGISRTVVLLAYDQLLAEGFAVGRSGSGTYVPEGLRSGRPPHRVSRADVRLSRFGCASEAAVSKLNFPGRPSTPLPYDFAYGQSDIDNFPFELWRRLLLRHARRAPVREYDYGPAAGSLALRDAISAHLRRSRAVVCDPSQVIVVNGSQQALDLIARVLIERGGPVAIENPAYQGTREILRAAGARLLPVPVDRDGVNPAKLPTDACMAFVTPSHQFPTGTILPVGRRLALLDWARRENAVVVEDDYDGEFRYGDQPLESLQGLDTEGRVIYIGTFSRTVFSALRIGYSIVPKSLIAAFTSAKWLCDRHTATLEQETLAEFITSGMYERHLRRVRRRNAARRNVLLAAIHDYLGDRVEVTGDGAGAHVVLWPHQPISENTAIEKAAARGVGIYGTSRYFLTRPSRTGLMLGYSRLTERQIGEGIRRLGTVL